MRFTAPLLSRDDFTQHKYLYLLAAAGFIAGIFFRFWDLGGAPLAVDEYFLGTSTLNTAEHGLPKFACGGYYRRGVLLQYLALPILSIGASLEFSVRFWPAVASILSIAAVWRIALMAGGTRSALIAVILMSLSLWEVEFGRFGRMYAPFQAAFLWYAFFQIQDLIKGNELARWWCLGISTLTAFIYAGAAMLLVFNFLPLIWPGKRWTIAHLTISFVLLFVTVQYYAADFRHWGLTEDQMPPMFDRSEEASAATISIPHPTGFSDLPESLLLLAATGIFLLGLVLWRYHRQLTIRHPSVIFWFATLACFCVGFMAFGVAMLLAGMLMRLPSPVRDLELSARSSAGWLAGLFLAWVAVLIVSFMFDGEDILSSIKHALRYTLDSPDVYYKVALPWLQAIPVTAVLLAALAGVSLILTLRSRQQTPPTAAVAGYVISTLIMMVLLVSMLPQPFATSRYTYFIYPLLIILASIGLNSLAGTRVAKSGFEFAVVVALLIPLFALAEDFRLSHLVRINKTEIRYRTVYAAPLAAHYYLRWDFRGAAFHVNENLSANDSVIVFDQPLPHYLDRTSGIFARAGSGIHNQIWACRGQRDLWSNAPLLDEVADVDKIINKTDGDVWLLMRTAKYAFRDPLEIELPARYQLKPEFITEDKYLAVYRIRNSDKNQ